MAQWARVACGLPWATGATTSTTAPAGGGKNTRTRGTACPSASAGNAPVAAGPPRRRQGRPRGPARDQARPATLHAPCVATFSRAAPCVVCEALDMDAVCCLPGAACRARAGLHGTRGPAGVGPPLGTVLPCGLGTFISRCRSSGMRTPVFVGRSSLFYCPHILF